jgi:hypothetical protein
MYRYTFYKSDGSMKAPEVRERMSEEELTAALGGKPERVPPDFWLKEIPNKKARVFSREDALFMKLPRNPHFHQVPFQGYIAGDAIVEEFERPEMPAHTMVGAVHHATVVA